MDGTRTDAVKVMDDSPPSRLRPRSYEVVLRVIALVLTLTSTIVVGSNRERKMLSLTVSKFLPTLHIPVTAKWQYLSSSIYFLVINAIACTYVAGSLIYSALASRRKPKIAAVVLTILDLIITGLMFSAIGATAAIGLIGEHGNSHLQWNRVCNLVSKYCHQMTAAFILSLLGGFVFLWLVVLSVLNMHKNSVN